MGCRTALQFEYLADGVGVRRVCAEAVNGFRREGDDLACAQGLNGPVDLVLG